MIVFQGSFHGRTHLTMAMTTSKTGYRAGYQPLPSGVFVAPFPYAFREGGSEAEAVDRALAGFDLLLASQTAPAETAAIVIEPVLGEGGYLPAPAAFLAGAAGASATSTASCSSPTRCSRGSAAPARCSRSRTSGVRPDVVVMAKGIASGFPISAIGASAELMGRWPIGAHGGTYGGNPIGCAAALATIDVLTAPGFLDDVRARGEQLRAGLRALAAQHPVIARRARPRAHGRLRADDAGGRARRGARRPRSIAHCRDEGRLLLMNAGTAGQRASAGCRRSWSARPRSTEGLDAFAAALAATA